VADAAAPGADVAEADTAAADAAAASIALVPDSSATDASAARAGAAAPASAAGPPSADLAAAAEPEESAPGALAPGVAGSAEPPAPAPAVRRPSRTITVRAGDGETLHRIARDHGVTVAEMERWNPHAVSGVTPGMRLRIEGSGAGSPAARAAAPGEPSGELARAGGGEAPPGRVLHRVRRGETLWSIARRYGVSVAQVRDWNDRRGSSIRAGERLVIFP
jgi:LysM repeat protein